MLPSGSVCASVTVVSVPGRLARRPPSTTRKKQPLVGLERWNLGTNLSPACPTARSLLKLNGECGVDFPRVFCDMLAFHRGLYAQTNGCIFVATGIHTIISGYWMGPDLEDGWGYVEAFVDEYF